MTGARRTIYAKSEEIWDGIEADAEQMDRSVSWLLIQTYLNSRAQTDSKKPADHEKFQSHRQSTDDTFRPHSKEQQLGKKVKK